METDEIRNKLVRLLENQNLFEAKLLLKKLEEIGDLTDIVSDQWLPLITDVEIQNEARIVAFIKSANQLGLGPVLLVQVDIFV